MLPELPVPLDPRRTPAPVPQTADGRLFSLGFSLMGGYGGALTAGLFLKEFTSGRPWVHLDIAGPAFTEKDSALGSKGGTGVAVRTLLTYLTSDAR